MLSPEETKPKDSLTNETSPVNDAFARLEKKYLNPDGVNEKFDLLLDRLRGVSVEEKIFFTQNLAVMLKSGLSVSRALRTLTLQSANHKFKRALFRVAGQVEKGVTLSEAMRAYPNIFSVIFVNMIKAGEAAGQMEEVLSELTHQLKKSHGLKQKVKGALMYPVAILIAMVGIGGGMLIFVVPKLLLIFKEMNVELPLPTRILIGLSDAVNNNILIIAPSIIIIAGGLIYGVRTRPGKKIWHSVILHLPVVKKIAVKINLADISRTLGSLLATDLPIVESLKLSAEVIKNVHYRASLEAMAEQVEKGKKISDEMAKFGNLYPPVVEQMVAVGEETGEISKILKDLAEFYEEDVNQTMDSLPSLIEPILIVALGGAVGGMAVAIILPMFSLSQAV